MSSIIRIALAGGQKLYRDALRMGLEQMAGLRVVHAVDLPSYDELADCDVLVVIASSLAEYELEELVEWLAEDQQILMLGPLAKPPIQVLEALASGRLAWLQSETSLEVMTNTLRQLAACEQTCSPQVLAFVAQQIQLCQQLEPSDEECRPTSLTVRQREIAALVAEGLINKQIARQLGIRVTTVKSHVHDLMRKFQVTRREALRRCVARSHTR